MTKRILLWFACGLCVLACDRRGSTPTPTPSSSAAALASAAASAAPAAAQSVPPRPQHPAERVLVTWNSALDRRDLDGLTKLYAPYVRFYGRRKSVAEVVGAKRMALGKEPDFRQRVGKVQIEKTEKGFNVHFEKQSGANFASAVAARLVLEGSGDELLISEETDAVTDKRLKEPRPASCYDAVMQVVSSQAAIEADVRRVTRTSPEVNPGGVLYTQEPGKLEAAQGYFHPHRFEPRWWIEFAGGELTIKDALSGEPFAISQAQRESVRAACSPAEPDAGAKK